MSYRFYIAGTMEEIAQLPATLLSIRALPAEDKATRFELDLDTGRTLLLTSMKSGAISFACRDTNPTPP